MLLITNILWFQFLRSKNIQQQLAINYNVMLTNIQLNLVLYLIYWKKKQKLGGGCLELVGLSQFQIGFQSFVFFGFFLGSQKIAEILAKFLNYGAYFFSIYFLAWIVFQILEESNCIFQLQIIKLFQSYLFSCIMQEIYMHIQFRVFQYCKILLLRILPAMTRNDWGVLLQICQILDTTING
eukprot:TRINITY_DN12129_c1_g1_i1.p6 TRINITY_DN12129_c1_g1~~TRINITY_DN12129_c1_g1_i1.p6  ORF type:complete len:182 (+),score=5.30 TRINITY_DN12129_c1_g1_i1:713-1258(+)